MISTFSLLGLVGLAGLVGLVGTWQSRWHGGKLVVKKKGFNLPELRRVTTCYHNKLCNICIYVIHVIYVYIVNFIYITYTKCIINV